jgi:hypothetical protein
LNAKCETVSTANDTKYACKLYWCAIITGLFKVGAQRVSFLLNNNLKCPDSLLGQIWGNYSPP